MRKSSYLSWLFLALASESAIHAQQPHSIPLSPEVAPPRINGETLRYGEHDGRLFLTVPRSREPAPLVVWLDGPDIQSDANSLSGAWLQSFLFDRGFALAHVSKPSENRYSARQVNRANVEAVRYLVQEAERLRIDPARIVLLGHGPGGNTAMLLGTDPTFLDEAGISFASVKGVIVLNSLGFDIPARIAASSRFHAGQLQRSFGNDLADQRVLSPEAHVETPNAPLFLFVAREERSTFADQADAMAAALRSRGTQADVWRVARTLRDAPSTYIGAPQHVRTEDLARTLLSMME